MRAHFHHTVSGHFRLEAVRPNGQRRLLAEFDNLITDWGLDRMGDNEDWLTACHVGSGNTAPANGDTALVSHVATTSTVQSDNSGNAASAPYYAWRKRVYRFAAGSAAGNLAEVAIGLGTASGDYAFSRALIRDGMGDPTTITILADEILDVTYEFRFYAPEADATGTVTDPETLVDHSWTGRASLVTNNVAWQISSNGRSMRNPGQNSDAKAHDGGIQAVTLAPSGSSSSAEALTPAAYSNGNHYVDLDIFFGLNFANFSPAGVGAVRFRLGIGIYQIGFDPKPLKTVDDELTVTVRVSWSRRP